MTESQTNITPPLQTIGNQQLSNVPVEQSQQLSTDHPVVQNKLIQQSQQKPTIDYSDPQVRDYFQKKLCKHIKGTALINNVMQQSQAKMNFCLSAGLLYISQQSKEISELLKFPNDPNKNEEKVKSIINRKAYLQSQLKIVEGELQNSRLVNKSSTKVQRSRSSLQMPQGEHRQFINRMIMARKQLQMKQRLTQQYQQKKKEQLQKKQSEYKKQEIIKLQQEKQKEHKARMEAIQLRRKKQKQDEQQSAIRFKSLSQQQKVHQILQNKYQSSIVLPILEERKKKLQEKKKMNQKFTPEEIKKFEREYLKAKEERQTISRSSQSENWHYKAPACSPKLMKILQQQKIQERIKLQQKKRALQQKISRQQSFLQYLKQQVPVKIDPKKKLQLQTLMKKEPISNKSQEQKQKIGNSYMYEAKKKIKHINRDKKQSLSTYEDKRMVPSQLKSNTSMNHYKNNESLLSVQNKKLDQLITSKDIDKYDKIEQLKLEVNRLGERAERRKQLGKLKNRKESQQDLEYLLSSIKAKVTLMDIYKQ